MLTGLAESNKMTYDQFAQHLKGTGVDIATIGERFRAKKAWRDLVMRRFGPQVTVTHRDVDRALSSSARRRQAMTPSSCRSARSRSGCRAVIRSH